MTDAVPSVDMTSEPSSSADTPSAKGAGEGSKSPSASELWKLKVDGEELEMTPDEVKKWAQIGRSKEKRYEEASKREKEAQSKLEAYKKDWTSALREAGMDPREIAEKWLVEQIKLERMSPDQKKAWENEQKLKTYEEREAEAKKAEMERKRQEEAQREEAAVDNEITSVLGEVNLPKTPGTIYRMAMYMLGGLDAREAAARLEEDYADDIRVFLQQNQNRSKYIPQDIYKQLMDEHLGKVRGAPQFASASEGSAQPQPPKKEERLSPAEFRKLFR